MQGDPNAWSNWATVYAAIVATGALFLELRRWLESGAKLQISYMLDGITLPRTDDEKYVVVYVTNRGDSATTITHFVFKVYPTWWSRLRRKPIQTFVVVRPATAQPTPHLLAPGTQWVGMGKQDETLNGLIDKGSLWVEIYATHADRPTSVHLRKRPKPEGRKLDGA